MDLKESYSILGIKPGVDLTIVKTAYRKLAMKFHPDVNKAPDVTKNFELINKAYETIKNKGKVINSMISSEFQDLAEDFAFQTHDNFKDVNELKEQFAHEKIDVEKYIYLTPAEAESGKEFEINYLVEKYKNNSDQPSFEYEFLNLKIPAGVKHEQILTIKGAGNETPDYQKSDLNLIIDIEGY